MIYNRKDLAYESFFMQKCLDSWDKKNDVSFWDSLDRRDSIIFRINFYLLYFSEIVQLIGSF